MAVQVLALLAYKEGDRAASALLAASINTNPVIVRRLLLALQRAKLVETRKGAGCGSRLSRSPARINLAEVFRAVEDAKLFGIPSRRPNAACPVGNCIREVLDKVCTSAQQSLERDLAKTSVAQVLDIVKASRIRTSKPGR
jgi:DNA-binding IscR family transcriptional regulator